MKIAKFKHSRYFNEVRNTEDSVLNLIFGLKHVVVKV